MLRLAGQEIFRPLWSADVLAELHRNLVEVGMPEQAVAYRISQMTAAFPDAAVTGYERLVGAMACDEKDRDELAAAARGRAEVLVTFNLRDFPAEATAPFDIEVVHPDVFLLDQLDLHPAETRRALDEQVAAYRRPPRDVQGLLDRLAASGVPRFAAAIADRP